MAVVTVSERLKFIESVFGRCRLARNGINVDVRCPMCAPRDRDKLKLSIRMDDDRNHCWTCGWRAFDLTTLIKRYGSNAQFIEYRDKYTCSRRAKRVSASQDDIDQTRVTLPPGYSLLATDPNRSDCARRVTSYLKSRGINEISMWRYRIGVSEDPEWIYKVLVPSFDVDGTVNYFVARNVDPQTRPRYVNPNVDRLAIIFNEIDVDWQRPVVICEGVFDMFKCGDNAVPLLGSELNERSLLFNRLVSNNVNVILALDSDVWDTKTLTVSHKLMSYGLNVSLVDTRPFDDPGKATVDQFKEALSRAIPVDWQFGFSRRLTVALGT